jgi:hypothetical protein
VLSFVLKLQGIHSTVPFRSVARKRSAVPLEMTAKLHAEYVCTAYYKIRKRRQRGGCFKRTRLYERLH